VPEAIDTAVKLTNLVVQIALGSCWVAALPAEDGPPQLRPLPAIPREGPASVPVAQSAAPAEVVASAVAAVARLGDEVVLGRYQVAVERMNPQWKERTAKRMGGMKELENQLAAVAQQMVQQGISIISFKPQGQPRSFEVGPGKEVVTVDNAEVENLTFSKWLVLIPTTTKFRVIRPGDPKPMVIESIGFQVAISEKAKLDWTFIDGSGLSLNDLRSLFVTLPRDLKLPPLGKQEIR
jgi:hypothetical protein